MNEEKKFEYSGDFYSSYKDQSSASAGSFVPEIVDLFSPKSVLDVGCGIGTWLNAFENAGIKDILGIDGSYVERDQLMVDRSRFKPVDLSKEVDLGRRFDLVTTFEVGEHLMPEDADTFVDTLVAHGDIVVFSAAIPNQGGTNHVNEQWPEYWAEKFIARNYVPVDCLRNRVWANPDVAYYYAQNTIAYVERAKFEALKEVDPLTFQESDPGALARVHPAKWMDSWNPRTLGLRRIVGALPHAVASAVRKRIAPS